LVTLISSTRAPEKLTWIQPRVVLEMIESLPVSCVLFEPVIE
jgi:hypothetical protein